MNLKPIHTMLNKWLHDAFLVVPLLFMLCSFDSFVCAQNIEIDTDTLNAPLIRLTQEEADSITFRYSHHYTINFNFKVVADSLFLIPDDPSLIDTCYVYKDEIIVVADIMQTASDTIWVKVFHDQYTMGWMLEKDLISNAIPDDTISQIIYYLSGSRAIWMSFLLLSGVVGFLFNRRRRKRLHLFSLRSQVPVFYAISLLIVVILIAAIYAGIQSFAPEYWLEYYFHPVLNPFILPPIMAVLVSLAWLVIILFLALVFACHERYSFLQCFDYILEIIGVSMLAYLVVSWSIILIF